MLARDLPFHSVCVHHFVPFFGRALIAYLPGERIIGISGLARLLDRYARRPQLQERITTQIADHLERLLAPRGVAVVLEARHLCMEMRGDPQRPAGSRRAPSAARSRSRAGRRRCAATGRPGAEQPMAAGRTVTVVMATRDRPELLRDALATVAAQTLRPLEVRIADDGERPAHEAAAALASLEVTVVPVRAGQAAAARNAAVAGARGEVLAFLDDDDRWRADHLARLTRAFEDDAVDLAFTDWAAVRERVDPSGARVELDRQMVALDWDDARVRRDDHVPPSTWGVRRALFERLAGFDESFRYSEDWDFLLRAAALTTPRRVHGVSVEVRLRALGNASADLGPERLECLARLARRHGLAPLEPKTFWEVAAEAAAPVA